MKRLFLFLAALTALLAAPLNAFAATYIQDNGNMFSSGAKNQATQLIDGLRQRTGKDVLVLTVPSLNGQDAATAADNAFRQNRVNGVLFFASRGDRKLEVVVAQDTKQALPDARAAQIRQTMLNDFRANNQQGFDKGLIDGVNAVGSTLGAAASSGTAATAPVQSGPNLVFIGLLILVAVLAVWVIAGIMRARRQQPYFSYGQQQQQPGTPGYGAPGYGGGPGFGGGGGFFGGLMGGIGGALLGNALFDAFRPRDQFNNNNLGGGGSDAGFQDQGWQGNDAGQVGDTTGGSWGDSGSGDPGGGGDSGGGDSGGGGGDW
ncbi:MAG TPA: TPM domain-containing protein [Chloroflexota bacterium]|nr:TPM domain-containing protein [Chloroflexota bacterium]